MLLPVSLCLQLFSSQKILHHSSLIFHVLHLLFCSLYWKLRKGFKCCIPTLGCSTSSSLYLHLSDTRTERFKRAHHHRHQTNTFRHPVFYSLILFFISYSSFLQLESLFVSIQFSASCLSLCQTMSFLLFLLILQCIVCLNSTSSPIARPFCSTSRLPLFSAFGHILLHGSCSSSPSHLLPGPQYSFNSLCSTLHLTLIVNSSCSSSFWIFSFMVSYHGKASIRDPASVMFISSFSSSLWAESCAFSVAITVSSCSAASLTETMAETNYYF